MYPQRCSYATPSLPAQGMPPGTTLALLLPTDTLTPLVQPVQLLLLAVTHQWA
jgi:hypothetical protein